MASVKGRSDGIQVLRALLFVAIIAFHCGVSGTSIFWGGVEIFFVISAYFLTKRLCKKSYNPFKEIGHRVSRLYPVYALVLLGAAAIVFFKNDVLAIKDFLVHAVFSQNVNWMTTGYKSELVSLTGHTWTLSIEIYAFLVYVFAFKLCKSNISKVVFNIAAIIAAITWRTVITVAVGDPMIASLCPVAHFDAFAIGSLLALFEARPIKNKTKSIALGATLALGVAVIVSCIAVSAFTSGRSFIEAFESYKTSANYFNNPYTCNLYIGFSLLGAGLLYFVKIPSFKALVFKPFVACGNVSYSAYLIHFPICQILRSKIANEWIAFAITLVATLIASFLVEWILSLIYKLINKRKNAKGEANVTAV